MRKKGRTGWLPSMVLDELDDIKREEQLDNKGDAFKFMTKYCRMGREINRIRRFDFTGKAPQVDIDNYPPEPDCKKLKTQLKRRLF
jgi:hypothetical protein